MSGIVEQNAVITRLLHSELGKKIEKEIQDEQLHARKKLLSEIHQQKDRRKQLPALQDEIDLAEKAMLDAKNKYQELEAKYRQCHCDKYTLENSIQSRINRLKLELRNTQPDYIGECIKWIDKEIVTCQNMPEVVKSNVDRSKFRLLPSGAKALRQTYSNRPSVVTRLHHLRIMKEDILKWQHQAFSVEEMTTEFERMKKELPQIEATKIN